MRLFCLATALLTANAFAGEKVLLRLNLKQDQRFEYQIKMKIAAPSVGSMSGTFHFAERTTKVAMTEYTQSVYLAGNSVKAEGMFSEAKDPFAELKGLSYTKVVAPNAKVKSIQGFSTSSFGSAIDIIYSEKPVEVGDTWTSTTKISGEFGDNEVTYKLISLTDSEARIEASLAKKDAIELSEPYLFIVDRETGRTKYSKGAIKATTSGTTIEIKYEMRMIVPLQPYQFQSGDM